MSDLDKFKAFVKTIPSIKDDVLNGRYTWQQLYECYVMYGEDDKFWLPYKASSSISGLNGFLEIIKNIDLDTLSNSLGAIEKVLNMVSALIVKDEPNKTPPPRGKWYDQ